MVKRFNWKNRRALLGALRPDYNLINRFLDLIPMGTPAGQYKCIEVKLYETDGDFGTGWLKEKSAMRRVWTTCCDCNVLLRLGFHTFKTRHLYRCMGIRLDFDMVAGFKSAEALYRYLIKIGLPPSFIVQTGPNSFHALISTRNHLVNDRIGWYLSWLVPGTDVMASPWEIKVPGTISKGQFLCQLYEYQLVIVDLKEWFEAQVCALESSPLDLDPFLSHEVHPSTVLLFFRWLSYEIERETGKPFTGGLSGFISKLGSMLRKLFSPIRYESPIKPRDLSWEYHPLCGSQLVLDWGYSKTFLGWFFEVSLQGISDGEFKNALLGTFGVLEGFFEDANSILEKTPYLPLSTDTGLDESKPKESMPNSYDSTWYLPAIESAVTEANPCTAKNKVSHAQQAQFLSRILGFLLKGKHGLGVGDIRDAFGLSQPTAVRMRNSWMNIGLIKLTEKGIANRKKDRFGIGEVLRKHLESSGNSVRIVVDRLNDEFPLVSGSRFENGIHWYRQLRNGRLSHEEAIATITENDQGTSRNWQAHGRSLEKLFIGQNQ